MEKSNEKTNLVPMLIYNMLSAVMVVVSLFVFNRLVLILDISVYVASLALILLLKINFISTRYGALNFLHILIPCVLFYRSEEINLIDYSPVLYFAAFVTLGVLVVYWLRLRDEFRLSVWMIMAVFCAMIFCASYSSAVLTNVMFDSSEKVTHECAIESVDFEFTKGNYAYVTVDSFIDGNQKWDLVVDRSFAESLTDENSLVIESGRGAFGLDYRDALNRNDYESLCYSIYFAIRFDFVLDTFECDYAKAQDYVIKSKDCFLLVLTWIYFMKRNHWNRCASQVKPLNKAAKELKDADMDRYWLFCYEVLTHGNLSGRWKEMKQANVSFIRKEIVDGFTDTNSQSN